MEGATVAQPTLSAWLDVVAGPASGERLPLAGEIRFGCAEPGPGALRGDRWLSPAQAWLRRGATGQYELEDLGAIEPTKVNGRAVRGSVPLSYGDVIELGSSRLVVSEPAAEQVPTAPVPLVESTSEARYTAASLGRRFVAFVIDSIIELGVAYAAFSVFSSNVGERGTNVVIAAVAFIIACQLTYRFLFESLWGQTLGKYVEGIRVVRMDGRPLDPNAVLVRSLFLWLEGIFLIGVLLVILTGRRERRRLGDLAAGTIVVPASVAHRGLARRTKDRVMLASPVVWCATIAVALSIIGPGLQSCADAGVTPPAAHEGTCLQSFGGLVAEVVAVNAGHPLRLPGYRVALERTRLASVGADGQTAAFKLSVTDTGTAPLAFNADGAAVKLWLPDGTVLSEVSDPSATFFGPTLNPGQTATGWVAFAVPTEEGDSIGQPTSDLAFPLIDSGHPYMGEMRLWQVSGAAGERAVRGLSR